MARPLGRQYLIDYYDCDPKALNDRRRIRKLLMDAAGKSNATIVSDTFHSFSPHGISGVIVVAESHIAIHTWPEHCFAALDVFSCSRRMKVRVVRELLTKGFGARKVVVKEVPRGKIPVRKNRS